MLSLLEGMYLIEKISFSEKSYISVLFWAFHDIAYNYTVSTVHYSKQGESGWGPYMQHVKYLIRVVNKF